MPKRCRPGQASLKEVLGTWVSLHCHILGQFCHQPASQGSCDWFDARVCVEGPVISDIVSHFTPSVFVFNPVWFFLLCFFFFFFLGRPEEPCGVWHWVCYLNVFDEWLCGWSLNAHVRRQLCQVLSLFPPFYHCFPGACVPGPFPPTPFFFSSFWCNYQAHLAWSVEDLFILSCILWGGWVEPTWTVWGDPYLHIF